MRSASSVPDVVKPLASSPIRLAPDLEFVVRTARSSSGSSSPERPHLEPLESRCRSGRTESRRSSLHPSRRRAREEEHQVDWSTRRWIPGGLTTYATALEPAMVWSVRASETEFSACGHRSRHRQRAVRIWEYLLSARAVSAYGACTSAWAAAYPEKFDTSFTEADPRVPIANPLRLEAGLRLGEAG